MEKMNDLRDLLSHEIMDLYSAEEQIIKAMPAMIQKAKNPELKQALKQHLAITEKQKTRLDQVQQLMQGKQGKGGTNEGDGLLSRLFKRSQVCRGMQGIISEGEKIMAEDMSPEVMDAAIIASAQKVEHYEICGYGTAKAYAEELNMTEVASLLDQTLNEEYDADDRLTNMAVSRLNKSAEKGAGRSTAGRAMTGTTGGRDTTTTQRATRSAMEMEMASSKRGATTGGRTAQGGAGTSKTAGASRTAASTRGTTGNRGNTGTTGKGTGRTITGRSGQTSGGRGNTPGRDL